MDQNDLLNNRPNSKTISDILSKVIKSDYDLALKIINSIPTGISISLDKSCKDIRHNAIGATFLRIKPWESLSFSSPRKPPARIFYNGEELQPQDMPIQIAAWKGIEVRDMELEFFWDDGIRKISVWNASPLFDSNGNITGAVGIFEDVTEKRRLERKLAVVNRKQLEEEWLYYIDAINNVADPFCILDNQCCFKYVTKKYASLYDKTPEELTGRSYWEVFPELIGSPFFEYCYRALEKQESVHFEFKAVYSDSWFENHFHPFREGIIAYCRNITERKRAQLELERSRQETIDILESIGDCFVSLDQALRFIYLNRVAENALGCSRETLMGKKITDCFPDMPPLILTFLTEALEEKTQKQFEMYLPSFDKWMEFNVYPSAKGVSIYFRDITQRKNTEEALRQSEERFQSIFNNNPDMVIIFREKDGKILEVNQKFLDILGFFREELKGKCFNDLNLMEENRMQELRQQLSQTSLNNYELELNTKYGEKLITIISSDCINIGGEPCQLVLIKDVTKEKKLETKISRLNRLNLIGEMAAGIGHEVRNPMTTVRGYLQLFQEQEEFLKFKDRLGVMIEELDRANSIITEFLTLARKKSSLQKKQQLNDIIKAIFPLLQADAIKNDKHLFMELGDLPELMLDEKEIRQVIHNLVRNGLEAMEAKGCVTIRTYREGDEAILAVCDQGKGIDPQLLDKIGNPFFTTKETGTGMGLPICFSIAERHDASIDIESNSDGTTVYVRFKIK